MLFDEFPMTLKQKMESTLASVFINMYLIVFRASETFASFECRADQVDG